MLRQIRFGIMCSGTKFQKWQADCIRSLLAVEGVKAELLIVEDRKQDPPFLSRLLRYPRNHLLWGAYTKFFKPESYRDEDMGRELGGIQQMRCRPVLEERHSQYFKAEDVNDIRAHNLDFILRFGFGIIRGEILEAAKHGVWSFHHGDEEKYRGGPPAFWEIYKGDPVTGVVLQKLTDKLDAGIILRKGYFRTIPVSYTKSLDNVLKGASSWPSILCKMLAEGKDIKQTESKTAAPIRKAPGNPQMMLFKARVFLNCVKALYEELFSHDTWNVGVVEEPITAFLKDDFRPTIRWLPEPKKGGFVADPFGVEYGGSLQILCERFEFGKQRGNIVTIDREGNTKATFDTGSHASYPCLISDGQSIYCVPETAESRRIQLWAAKEFPDRWERLNDLVAGFRAVDPTVFRYGDRWWMACSDEESTNIYMWWSSDIRGPWNPHKSNPVKTDIRSARPAGTPFIKDGSLYRPAQDCSREYGGATVINRIVKLTEDEFEEETVTYVKPYATFVAGNHTLSSMGECTLVDGKRKTFRVEMLVQAIKNRVAKSGNAK